MAQVRYAAAKYTQVRYEAGWEPEAHGDRCVFCQAEVSAMDSFPLRVCGDCDYSSNRPRRIGSRLVPVPTECLSLSRIDLFRVPQIVENV